jgi:hypothetical protein
MKKKHRTTFGIIAIILAIVVVAIYLKNTLPGNPPVTALGHHYLEDYNQTGIVLEYTGELPVTILIPEQDSIAQPENLPHELDLPHPPKMGLIPTRFTVFLHKGYFTFTLIINDQVWEIAIPEFDQP